MDEVTSFSADTMNSTICMKRLELGFFVIFERIFVTCVMKENLCLG